MKRLSLKGLLFVLFLFCSSSIWASYSFEEGGIYYNITSEEGDEIQTVEVTNSLGGSKTSTASEDYSGDVDIPETVTYDEVEYTVTAIGDYAFYYCTELGAVAVPSTVQTIGTYGFGGFNTLHPEGLTSITFGEGSQLQTIESYAFRYCTSLNTIEIPSSVTEIDTYALEGCAGLQSVTFGEDSQLQTIGNYVFHNCTSLTSITIPDGVTSIGNYMFYGCSALTSITIPASVTSIGSGVFRGCTSLASITIPEGVTSIGSQAFESCTSLTSITIPASVTSIGNQAFYNCI